MLGVRLNFVKKCDKFVYEFIIKFVYMLLKDQCISITDLRTKTKQCLENLGDGEKYVFINNKPKVVIMDIEIFEKIVKPALVELKKNEVTVGLKKNIEKSKKTKLKDLIDI